MKKALIIFIVAALLVAGAAAAWFVSSTWKPASSPQPGVEAGAPFVFDDAGLYFQYPRMYVFESYPLNDESVSWTSLMLIRAADKASAEANGASEGPVFINVGIFPNPDHETIESWVQNSPHSNFALSKDQKMNATTLGGQKAYSYEHSGLFESDAIAVAHGDFIYLFEGSWADAHDTIRSDFQNLLKTVTFK